MIALALYAFGLGATYVRQMDTFNIGLNTCELITVQMVTRNTIRVYNSKRNLKPYRCSLTSALYLPGFNNSAKFDLDFKFQLQRILLTSEIYSINKNYVIINEFEIKENCN